MEVIECGTLVTSKLMKGDGMITCVSIRFDKVSYEVSYFVDGKYETVWLNEREFVVKGSDIKGYVKKIGVGYKSE